MQQKRRRSSRNHPHTCYLLRATYYQVGGPEAFDEPLLELAAMALRQPEPEQAPFKCIVCCVQCALHTLCSMLCTLHFAPYTLYSVLYVNSILYTPQSMYRTPYSKLHTLYTQIVPALKPLVKIAMGKAESAGAVELLTAAMQASKIVDEPLNARLIAEPQRLAKEETKAEEYAASKDIAMVALSQVFESIA